MKINSPLSVLRAVHQNLEDITMAMRNVCQETSNGSLVSVESLRQLCSHTENTSHLVKICLKLSDPNWNGEELTESDKDFLAQLYLPAAAEIDEEDEKEEIEEDILEEEEQKCQN